MNHQAGPLAKRPRISIDAEPELRRQLRLAAANRDVTLRQYVLEAIKARLLQENLADLDDSVVLTVTTDPVSAEL